MLDYLTLVGDAVDNVPGVDKVGPKTAAKWLEQYGSLEEVVRHADEIGGAVGENLRKALDWLPKAQAIARGEMRSRVAGEAGRAEARSPGREASCRIDFPFRIQNLAEGYGGRLKRDSASGGQPRARSRGPR